MPSDILRELISKTIEFPLNKYKWDEELKKRIFNIKTDPYIEKYEKSLYQIKAKSLKKDI